MKLELAPPDQKLLALLKAEQDTEGTGADFVRTYLPFSPSKWSKILNAIDPAAERSYFDEVSPESGRATLDDLAAILDQIPRMRAQAERLNSLEVLDLSHFRAVKIAVEEASGKRNPERLIKYLAPTGGGKSMLCTYLAKKCNAKVVESRETWKRSYLTVLEDLSRALGCRLAGERRVAAIEDKLVDLLSAQRTVLVIDEAEFFGTAALNGIKLLLNKTRLVIVLCAIAEAHDRWVKYYPLESSQLDRRTHAVTRLTTIDPEDAKKFFPARQFENEPASLARICDEASRFGHYSLLARLAHSLSKKEKADTREVESALKKSLREMNRTPLTKN